MVPNLKLSTSSGVPLSPDDVTTYRRLVGHLLYLQISRPDISFSIHNFESVYPMTVHGSLVGSAFSVTLSERDPLAKVYFYGHLILFNLRPLLMLIRVLIWILVDR